MKNSTKIPTVTIVGRPNVGKSTFFNRVCGSRKAIESEVAKTTIDRIYTNVSWSGSEFLLTDTAGLVGDQKNSPFEKEISGNTECAINESELVIFMIDVNNINSEDKEIAKKLHQSKKKVFLVANKADNQARELVTKEILALGFGEPNFISAISGRGTGDVLEKISKIIPKVKNAREKHEDDGIKVSIIGRPNVGKSTLLNKITDQKKAITDKNPGTTRDVNESIVNYSGQNYKIMDTAGIRRRGKISKGIEKYSMMRSLMAIKESDICLVLIDATEGLTNQDAHLVGTAKDLGKSIILLVNKVDIWEKLSEKKQMEAKTQMITNLQNELAFVPFVPVVFISGLKGTNVKKIFSITEKIYKQRFVEIGEEQLENILIQATNNNQQFPQKAKFYQERTNPPVFKLVVKNKKKIHFSHLRYLENIIRDNSPFEGTPIFIDLVERTN